MPDLTPASVTPGAAGASASAIGVLRGHVGELLRELAARTEPALHAALARAENAWDQADAVSIMDEDLRARTAALQARWRHVAASGAAGATAAALEALLVLEASLGLVAVVERRLAPLIRLRLAGGGDLLPDGRPFLDVSAALAEAAREWA